MMRAAVLALSCCLLAPALAGDFQRIYDAALDADATLRAARAELASVRQNIPLAQSALLPNVSLSVSDAKVEGSRTANNFFGQPVTSDLNYRSPVYSLNFRLPLFDREANRKLEIARLQVANAEALFAARTADLLDRLGGAYLQRLLTEQAVLAAQSQIDAVRMQLDMARRRMALGEGTRTEVAEAETTLDMAQVVLLEAQDQRQTSTLALQQLTGLQELPRAGPNLAVVPPALPGASLTAPASLTQLLEQANVQNPGILARQFALAAAQAAVARNESGHYPRLDLVASAVSSRNESISTLNQATYQRSLGLQLTVPLYSGGAVSAAVTQALADRDKTEAELTAERQAVARDVTRLFAAATSGAARIAAQQKAIAFAALALEAASKTFAAGLGTQTDTALARRKLVQAQRDAAQSVYEYLLVRIRLLVRVGLAPLLIVADMDRLLQEPATARP